MINVFPISLNTLSILTQSAVNILTYNISQVVEAFNALGWHKPVSIYEQDEPEKAQSTCTNWLQLPSKN